MDSPFPPFCAAVCRQVRAAADHSAITAELTAHLEDHAQALTAGGLDPDAAACEAVKAMGDPAELGRALDRLHSPWPERVYRLCKTLMVLGLMLLLFLFAPIYNTGPPLPVFPDPLPPADCSLPVLSQGTATGGGTVGDYTLSPAGPALVHRDPERPEQGPTLHFWVLERHILPWLGSLRCPLYALTAVDDLGNRYHPEQITMDFGASAHLGSWQEVRLTGLDPAAAQLDLFLDAQRGGVSFTIRLGEGAAA